MVLNEFKIEETLQKLELQLNRPSECSEGHELFKQIVPTQNELEALPVNIVDQPYDSIEHYRKTHYKLLHEDLIGPLRISIRTFCEGQGTAEFKRLKVYRNVRFIKCFPSWKGIQYMVTFDTASLKVKLPRRLLYGNLVCLSSDRFQDDLIFATIAYRTCSKVKQGMIGLKFLESSNDDTKQFRDFRQRKKGYTMIECDSHYIATKSVLNGLKDLKTLPLQDKIVSCTPNLSTPAYLSKPEQVKLDFTSLTGDKKHKNVQLLNIKMWPKPEEMGLNEEQRSAVHSALTTDLAVIQGGAGTGKSKVGNTIMKLLSQNQHLWNTQNQQICPILVICYGNQALDQFLEGIVDFFPEKILRVGGRCRSDKLHCFTMAHIKRQTELKASKTERYDYWITREQRREVGREIKKVIEPTFVLKFRLIRNVMSDKIIRELTNQGHEDKKMQNLGYAGPDFPLINWLGLPSTEIDIDADESLSEDDNVDDDEYNDNDERLIDTDDEMENEDFGRANSVISSAPSKKAALVYLNGKVVPAQYDLKQSRFFPETQLRKVIKQKLTETKIYTDSELNKSRQGLFDLPIKIRWRLYRYWVHQWVLHEQEKFGFHCQKYDKLSRRLQFLRRKEEKRILSQSYVIGMTTTAAAKYRDVLQDINVKIVFAEEAAEILEAHIATALPKSTQHLIMIGDNKQSRPRVNMPELSTKHNLGISMLERLIQCGIPSHSLNKQYRMSPNIADLLRHSFYPKLTEDPIPLDEMKVQGIRNNVFFIRHNEDETLDHYGKSKVNYYEAEYLLGLCKFLLGQGYRAEDITILTSYTGQMMEIQSQIQTLSLLNKVAVTNIDYFKGQENKIILLSLVCKNEEGKIDFLSAPNRICVALSRASLGLYCIGNFEKLQKHSLWNDIIQHLNNQGCIGLSLPIACTQHPNSIWTSNGFPETDAWCGVPCNEPLVDCGHLCTRTCHPSNTKHSLCEVPCEHVCEKDSKHKCKRVCHEKCDGRCLERVGVSNH
uniref:NFX1-type zinc finger-containing protein 1 n=1 Tax=Ciona intestinalis TaxID=7719 RepID=UPI000EF52406|nr:NFX1-type zinc finger-containing protein 1 [Ciona intestinalis]|eukprot:XP_026695934.1 NFX1-type zinc finger-containing protein 1 [Ciona intestinalis]